MIDSQVRTNDVHGRLLLAAMSETPREAFVPEARRGLAYVDAAVKTGPNRWLWAPRDFAKLLYAAEIAEGDRVLDIAPGTGYSTAVIARMAASVCAIEESDAAAAALRESLARAGVAGVDVAAGALRAGRPDKAPFNAIFVNGAVEEVPPAWLDQLADGGRLAVVVAEGAVRRGRIYTRSGGRTAWRTPFDSTAPFLPGFEKVAAFRL